MDYFGWIKGDPDQGPNGRNLTRADFGIVRGIGLFMFALGWVPPVTGLILLLLAGGDDPVVPGFSWWAVLAGVAVVTVVMTYHYAMGWALLSLAHIGNTVNAMAAAAEVNPKPPGEE